MAILRGGRRIGNYDIRVGLPRDRSLVDVEKDPRLKRQPGGSGQIQRFQSQINQGEGFARTNRYIVRINPPARVFDNPYAGDFDMTTKARGLVRRAVLAGWMIERLARNEPPRL